VRSKETMYGGEVNVVAEIGGVCMICCSTGIGGGIRLGSTKYEGEAYTCSIWFGGAEFLIEDGGIFTYF